MEHLFQYCHFESAEMKFMICIAEVDSDHKWAKYLNELSNFPPHPPKRK